jgi:hypothetical protein
MMEDIQMEIQLMLIFTRLVFMLFSVLSGFVTILFTLSDSRFFVMVATEFLPLFFIGCC